MKIDVVVARKLSLLILESGFELRDICEHFGLTVEDLDRCNDTLTFEQAIKVINLEFGFDEPERMIDL